MTVREVVAIALAVLVNAHLYLHPAVGSPLPEDPEPPPRTGSYPHQSLFDALAAGDEKTRAQAFQTLEKVLTKDDFEILRRAASDRRPEVRAGAFRFIWLVRDEKSKAVAVVLRGMHDPDVRVRRVATQAAAYFARNTPAVREELIGALQSHDVPGNPDTEMSVSSCAARSLACAGPLARPAYPLLMKQALHGHSERKRAAYWALGRLASEDVETRTNLLRFLIRAMYLDGDNAAPLFAAAAIGLVRKDAAEALSPLLERYRAYENCSRPKAAEFRETILATLALLEASAAEGLPVLLRIVEDDRKDSSERVLAATAIMRLGPAGRQAIPRLKAVLGRKGLPFTLTETLKRTVNTLEHTPSR